MVKTCHENNFYVSPCIWQEGCNSRKFGKKRNLQQHHHKRGSKRVEVTSPVAQVADGTALAFSSSSSLPSTCTSSSSACASFSLASNDAPGKTAIEASSSTDDDTSTTAIWGNSGDYCYCSPGNDDSSGSSEKGEKCLPSSCSSSSASPLPLDGPVIQLMQVTWGQFTGDIFSIEDASLDFVLASDCFYDTKDFEDIVASVYFLLRVKGKPNCTFLTSYQERNSDWSIDCLLDRWNLKGCEISLESFEASQSQLLGSRLPGSCTVSLFKISLK